MRIVNPSVSILDEPKTPLDVLKHIERCGRICYKSEHKITDDSYIRFINNIIDRGHTSVLEHGNLILRCDFSLFSWFTVRLRAALADGKRVYIRTTSDNAHSRYIVSGNLRAFREFLLYNPVIPPCFEALYKDFWPVFIGCDAKGPDTSARYEIIHSDDLTKDERAVHACYTVNFEVDRGVSHELVRHRVASFSQESTRYCNYAKDDFGNEITVIRPLGFFAGTNEYNVWYKECLAAEKAYFDILDCGCTAQTARSILPNSLKTEVMMTATLGDWLAFLTLRESPAAHPQMREVAKMLSSEIIKHLQ